MVAGTLGGLASLVSRGSADSIDPEYGLHVEVSPHQYYVVADGTSEYSLDVKLNNIFLNGQRTAGIDWKFTVPEGFDFFNAHPPTSNDFLKDIKWMLILLILLRQTVVQQHL